MSVPRFKVWTIDPDGEPGTLLLRTGSTDKHVGVYDASFAGLIAGVTAEDVAENACIRTGHTGWVLVKDFDTDEWTVVGVSR